MNTDYLLTCWDNNGSKREHRTGSRVFCEKVTEKAIEGKYVSQR